MLLDEFVSLGRMDNLKTAITTLREYNVRVMLVVQTISSLRDLYGKDGAGTFISNCGVQLFMGPADEETPDYISQGHRRLHPQVAFEVVEGGRADDLVLGADGKRAR